MQKLAPVTNPLTMLLKLPEVENATGKKRSALYAAIKAQDFPAPVKIGPRASAWVAAEVQEWIDSRIAERDQTQGGEA